MANNPNVSQGRPTPADGEQIADQLAGTTTEDAGGNVSGTAAEADCEDLEILFESEDEEQRPH